MLARWSMITSAPAGVRARLARHPRIEKWIRPVALGAGLALPVLFFLRYLLVHPTYIGRFGDIRSFHMMWAVSRTTVLRFGQLPYWDPYYCGGMVHWANAETMFLAPTFLLNLIAGPGFGIRAYIVIHFVAGFVGCYVLARHHGIRGAASIAPGVVYVFGANFAERATGHVGFMPFLLLPWMTYLYDRARTDLRFALLAGLLLAYTVIAGAPYPFTMFSLYVALLVAFDVASRIVAIVRARRARRRDPTRLWEPPPRLREIARPLLIGAVVAGLALLLAAIKLGPVADFLREYPRVQHETDHLAAWQVWEVFLEPDLVRHREGYFYVFGEYRNYLGPAAMLAVPLMLFFIRRHARDYWVIVAAGALMLGNLGALSPYALLAHLPVYGSLRVPVRFAILVDLHIGLLFGHALATAAAGLRALRPQRRRLYRLGQLALLAVLLGSAADLMTNNNRQHEGFFDTPPDPAPRAGPFRMIAGSPHEYPFAPARNEGYLRCYDPHPLAISPALRPFAPAQAYVTEGDGAVTIAEWTPNRLTLDVAVPAPRTVAINMNYHRDWHADGGGAVRPWRGLLAVDVPPGETRVSLWYRPRRIGLYAGISAAGWVLGLLAWRRLGRRTDDGP